MKRFVIGLMILALAVGCFAACGQPQPEEPTRSDTEVQTPTIDEAIVETEETQSQPVALSSDGDLVTTPTSVVSSGDLVVRPSELHIVLVAADSVDTDPLAAGAKQGLEQLKSEYGVDVQLVECHGTDYAAAMRSAAGAATVVVCVGAALTEIETVAPEFEGVRWIWLDGTPDKAAANVLYVGFAVNEGAYLAGYLAAEYSSTGVIGAVCAAQDPATQNYLAGFRQGAAARNEHIRVEVLYTGSSDDTAKAKKATYELSGKGADVILMLAGNANDGIAEAAKDDDLCLIGTQEDQFALAEELVLCAVVSDGARAAHDAVLFYMRGDTARWGGSYLGRLSDGFVRISYGKGSAGLVPEQLQAELEEITMQIITGDTVVDKAD